MDTVLCAVVTKSAWLALRDQALRSRDCFPAGCSEARCGSAVHDPWSAVSAGALLAVNATARWTYAVFLVLLTGVLVAWRLLIPSGGAR